MKRSVIKGKLMINRPAAIYLLTQLREGKITIDELFHRWPHQANDLVLERVRCLLDHYAADADIRAKDPDYAEWQKTQLEEYIGDLEND
jgi:hypothetical protein